MSVFLIRKLGVQRKPIMNRLILASTSPRRIRLLREHRFDAVVAPPSVDEIYDAYLTPLELVLFNAHRKAAAVAPRFPEDVVLAADTIVVLGTEIFGKPRDMDEARRMLRSLTGRTHEVLTGIALISEAHRNTILRTEETYVTFRLLDDVEIDQYLCQINPLDKAGAYAAQESPELIIDRVEGSFTNVIGLPMELIVPLLKKAGIEPKASAQPPSN